MMNNQELSSNQMLEAIQRLSKQEYDVLQNAREQNALKAKKMDDALIKQSYMKNVKSKEEETKRAADLAIKEAQEMMEREEAEKQFQQTQNAAVNQFLMDKMREHQQLANNHLYNTPGISTHIKQVPKNQQTDQ